MNRYLLLLVATVAACKGKDNGPVELGPPASMSVAPATPRAPANTELSNVQLTVRDAKNNPLPNQTVTFTVTGGGGSLTTTTATTGPDGTLIVPAWKLGKLDVPQTLQATTGSVTFTINASVQTSYNLVLRFYGTSPTTAQRAMFDNAAARIRAVVTGDLANVSTGGNFDISACTPGQTTTINETIDDVVVYVQLTNIDGQGNVLASAGPCFVRQSGGPDSLTTVIGTMRFDTSDLGILREETILHEMLHVIGHGAMWVDPPPNGWGLISGAGGPTPRYTGVQGRLGCQEIGGTVTCANSVPVEDTLGPGTRDVHWEEFDFDTELMTGFVEHPSRPMPFSLMTVRSLRDIGYTVNTANFDPYTKPGGALRAAESSPVARSRWETTAPVPVQEIGPDGRVGRVLRRAQ